MWNPRCQRFWIPAFSGMASYRINRDRVLAEMAKVDELAFLSEIIDTLEEIGQQRQKLDWSRSLQWKVSLLLTIALVFTVVAKGCSWDAPDVSKPPQVIPTSWNERSMAGSKAGRKIHPECQLAQSVSNSLLLVHFLRYSSATALSLKSNFCVPII